MSPPAAKNRAAGLYTIIAIKLGKGLLLLLLALGIYSLMGENLREQFDRFLRWASLDPEQQFFAALGQKLQGITPAKLKGLALGTLLYSVLLFCESVGLMFRTFWAAWLAIGETAFFVPFEVLDLIRGFSLTVFVILVGNVAIVWYLVRNRNRLFHHRHAPEPPEDPATAI